MRNRVVITGLGAISPLGLDAPALWDALVAGRSGIARIASFETDGLPVTFAGEVKGFQPEAWIDPKEVKKLDRFLQFAVAASVMALRDAGLVVSDEIADDVAVYIGSGVGGLATIDEAYHTLDDRGLRKLSPFAIPKMLINMAPGQVSIATGARGPNLSHVSACATGNHAIGEAARLIRHGDAKVAIAGGSEAPVGPLAISGFSRMRALSLRNDEPERASRPFDAGRDGFVIGEGCGIVVLEDLDFAVARGARIYCELAGYAANSDAFHMTAPSPEGQGAARCMQRTLKDAGWSPGEVDYINAHGTGTTFGDVAETCAIKQVFGDHARELPVSSTKSMTGHLLGAAGGIEAVICALALAHGVVPPTINLDDPDPACDLDYVPGHAREVRIRRIVSNAFGFGGTNGCLAFRAL